jgi:hypothetical protein
VSGAIQIETIDRRVLGGVVFIDSLTGASITDPLTVSSSTLDLRANRSGVYVIFNAPGFSALTGAFTPVAGNWPAAQSFEVTVRDPSLCHLPRRAQVQAPQALAGASTPQTVTVYASPSAPLAPNWGVLRLSVQGSAGTGLPWAVVQALRADNTVAATGMTDARGEALLAVTGIGVQVSANASGPVTEKSIPLTMKAWFDPGVLAQPAGWIADPDSILSNPANAALKTATQTGTLGRGQTLFVTIPVPA